MGIIERIGGLAGSDVAKAVNLAHDTFQERLAVHGHHGRALIETLVIVCRKHPALVGLAAGILVEQLLARAEEHAEVREAVRDVQTGKPPSKEVASALGLKRAAPSHIPHHLIRMGQIRPFRLSVEVFGALLLFKFGAAVAKAFRRKNAREIWFAPAAKVGLVSGALAAYFGAKAVRNKNISAWDTAAAAFFTCHAVKPVMRLEKGRRAAAPPPAPIPPPPAAAHEAPPAAHPEPAPPPAPAPAPAAASHDNGHGHHHHHGRDDDRHGHGHDDHGHAAQAAHAHADEPPEPGAHAVFHPVPDAPPAVRHDELEPEPDTI